MMNCDLAFEYLTDPDRMHDPALDEHLRSCARCRQMQETLEPALALFQSDCVGDDRTASATPPLLSLEAVQIAETTARTLAVRARPPRGQRWANLLGRCAALVFVGGVITLAAIGLERASQPSAAGALASGECLWLSKRDRTSHGDVRSVVLSCLACHVDATVK